MLPTHVCQAFRPLRLRTVRSIGSCCPHWKLALRRHRRPRSTPWRRKTRHKDTATQQALSKWRGVPALLQHEPAGRFACVSGDGSPRVPDLLDPSPLGAQTGALRTPTRKPLATDGIFHRGRHHRGREHKALVILGVRLAQLQERGFNLRQQDVVPWA